MLLRPQILSSLREIIPNSSDVHNKGRELSLARMRKMWQKDKLERFQEGEAFDVPLGLEMWKPTCKYQREASRN